MSSAEPTSPLRTGLLDGVAIVLAASAASAASGASGAPGAPAPIAQACEALGARVARCELPVGGDGEVDDAAAREAAVEVSVRAALAELDGEAQLLIVDGGGWFAAGGGRRSLVDCLQASWDATRALANAAFLPDGRGGRIVLLAPADGAEHATAAAAGLENLARTLSIEWARFAITTVAIAPGAGTAGGELATVVAYLASPAGAYFSGCLLDFRGPSAPHSGS
jgi:NAD(P)-dependent dehydrogenase (short-subunit alcohol dehydrogenase family)